MPSTGHDYMDYMDCMNLNSLCPKKADIHNHSLTYNFPFPSGIKIFKVVDLYHLIPDVTLYTWVSVGPVGQSNSYKYVRIKACQEITLLH